MTVFSARINLRFFTVAACLIGLYLSTHKVYAGPPGPSYQRPDQHYAVIFGTVWGPDDHPLFGVKVKIRRAEEKKARWELQSDHRGEFAQRVPPGPGDYLVWADLKGFKSQSGKELHQDAEVKVHIDNEERQDIGLHLK